MINGPGFMTESQKEREREFLATLASESAKRDRKVPIRLRLTVLTPGEYEITIPQDDPWKFDLTRLA